MNKQSLKAAAFALLGASSLSVAHAQVSPLCANLGPYLEGAMASQPFEALKNGGSVVYPPKPLTTGTCNIVRAETRPELTCKVTSYTLPERLDGDRRAVLEGEHENIRKNTIAHLKTCDALSSWTISPDSEWPGSTYGQSGRETLMTDPETGRQIGGRTVVDRSGSKGRWQYQFTTYMVFLTPAKD